MDLQSSRISGITVIGYYEEGQKIKFTCLNQDHNTPFSEFRLDYELDYIKGLIHKNKHQKNTVFVPIVKPAV